MSSETTLPSGSRRIWAVNPLQIYTAVISGFGLILLAWALSQVVWLWPQVLLFVLIIVLTESTTSNVFTSQLAFSMSNVVIVATLLLLGAWSAVVVAAMGGLSTTLVTDIARKRLTEPSNAPPFIQRALFNMAAHSVPTLVAGSLYLILRGRVGDVAHLTNLFPIVFVAIVYELLNVALVVGAVAIQTRQAPYRICLQNISWAIPIDILTMSIGGSGLALGYQLAGGLGLAVFLLPIVLTIYSFRLYVERTKVQMTRLEETINERTEELQQANEELKRLDQIKTGFFSMINHEMRTPLSAILGYAEILQLKASLRESELEMVYFIEESGLRLLGMVNNILDISRLEDGQLSLFPKKVPLSPAIDGALNYFKPTIDKRHLEVDLELPDNLPDIYGDPERVGQILLNIVGNAVKYTPDTGLITIAVQHHQNSEMLEVSISDTGVGIPGDLLPYIFDRFSRAERDEIRYVAGTGLGLSIAKGLVEAHGGEILVESHEGQGTCFRFTLPIATESDAV